MSPSWNTSPLSEATLIRSIDWIALDPSTHSSTELDPLGSEQDDPLRRSPDSQLLAALAHLGAPSAASKTAKLGPTSIGAFVGLEVTGSLKVGAFEMVGLGVTLLVGLGVAVGGEVEGGVVSRVGSEVTTSVG